MQSEFSGVIFSIGRLSISYNLACIALPFMMGIDILEDEEENEIHIFAIGILCFQIVFDLS